MCATGGVSIFVHTCHVSDHQTYFILAKDNLCEYKMRFLMIVSFINVTKPFKTGLCGENRPLNLITGFATLAARLGMKSL